MEILTENEIRKDITTTIYSSLFSNDGKYLFAANNHGFLNVFQISEAFNQKFWKKQINQTNNFDYQIKPFLSIYTIPDNSKSKCLYCLEFGKTSSQEELLFIGGENGVSIWKWREKSGEISLSQNINPLIHLQTTKQSISTNESISEIPEVNDIAYDSKNNILFGATGNNIIDVWDLETQKIIRNLENHKDYIHCIKYLPNFDLLISGSDDGFVTFWDMRSNSPTMNLDISKGEIINDKNYTGFTKSNSAWVSCLDTDSSEKWLVCGTGLNCLMVWNITSGKISSILPTYSCPQNVKFNSSDIFSVGNERNIYNWSLQGKIKSISHPNRFQSLSSIFSFAIHNFTFENSLFVASGNSTSIPIFIGETISSSLSFKFQNRRIPIQK
ncbi:tho complex subunit 6 [Anaeramoeba ignava]|uniref:Tho complex subunit 6 n=1 Tax=Anaeramoeba ignava TaxID=1746090 RepID=A0A9Q0LTA9_ANAIG|nr:tho complex subunit 6 [Anaeramoeba ignava]